MNISRYDFSFEEILQAKAKLEKIFEGKRLFRILPTIHPPIFCKIIFFYEFIDKCITDPDNNFNRNSISTLPMLRLLFALVK